jgi:hypothetical protein
MHRLSRLIALVLVGVLGLQTGAMALHTHFFKEPHPTQLTLDSHHGQNDARSDHAAHSADNHHSAGCIIAQSCFPVAHAVGPASLAVVKAPVLPVPATVAALPSPRVDSLLRPPRQLG